MTRPITEEELERVRATVLALPPLPDDVLAEIALILAEGHRTRARKAAP